MARHHGEKQSLDEVQCRLEELVDRRTRIGLTAMERDEYDCLLAAENEYLRQRGDL